MAYKKWRDDNISLIERQQALEALNGFKTYREKYEKDQVINPKFGKKNLRTLSKIRKMKSKPTTVTEILSIQMEISSMALNNLIEEEPREPQNESNETNVGNYAQDTITEYDKSEDSESNNDEIEESFSKIGKMTGDLFSDMFTPFLENIMNTAKPFIVDLVTKIDERRKDPSLPTEFRPQYEEAFQYYSEVQTIYNSNMPQLQQITIFKELEKKYNKTNIELLIKSDPEIAGIQSSEVDTSDIEEATAQLQQQLGSNDQQCVVS